MAENMYNKAHKAATKAFRDGWDETFGKRKKDKKKEDESEENTVRLFGEHLSQAANTIKELIKKQ